MNMLSFDTCTDVMSIALQRDVDGVPRTWQHTGAGGAQASSTLIPAIQQLLREADLRFDELDAVVFGRGPGSFTGLRTACSVAQGLAFGAGVKVLPVDTLLAVAEEARYQSAPDDASLRVLALLDARMDEVYVAHYEFNSGRWKQHEGYNLIRPENLVLPAGWQGADWLLAGNAFASYAERLPFAAPVRRIQALPTATAMLRLAPALLAAGQAVRADEALPTYIRDKVAQTTQERADQKAAQQA
ncbi:MAG: tRNA (adenosine(37)-N6)-threonylcarbamoyltransferase complex dimerization subunit type 1 TsaB [Rhodoferax sp.]|nr:tRNA (adenosine(37)-N6)-threonylcarbamoyltransferase complex dimerization subunit type 1 TsaB [Rhodoferax sp.]